MRWTRHSHGGGLPDYESDTGHKVMQFRNAVGTPWRLERPVELPAPLDEVYSWHRTLREAKAVAARDV